MGIQLTNKHAQVRRSGAPTPTVLVLLALLLIAAIILVLVMFGPRPPTPSNLTDLPPRPAEWLEGESELDASAAKAIHQARIQTEAKPEAFVRSPPGAAAPQAGPVNLSADSVSPAPDAQSVTDWRPAPTRPDDEEALSIAGSVLDDAGAPLPGVEVQVGDRGETVITDALGMFLVRNLEAGAHMLSVSETARHHGARRSVPAGAQAADLHLQRKGRVEIAGRVMDTQGQPIAGARVSALGQREQSLSDSSGAYAFEAELLRANASPVLDFSHPDYRTTRRRIALNHADPFARISIDVQLESEHQKAEVNGWVNSRSGDAVTGARVELSSLQPPALHSTVSDRSGDFRFRQVELGASYTVRVIPPDDGHAHYRFDGLAIGPDGAFHEVVLEPSTEARLSGLLVDLEGQPLRDLPVWLRHSDVPGHPSLPIHVDSQGHFGPLRVPAGTLQLLTHADPQLQASGITLGSREAREVLVPLDWGKGWLLGRVIDERGMPLARASVVAQWQQQFPEARSASRRHTLTDLEGYFHFANLGAPEYQLTVQASGHLTHRSLARAGASDEIVLQIRRLELAEGEGSG